jgi:hypothetical protein
MAVTEQDAARAIDAVLNKYGKYLNAGYVLGMRGLPAGEIIKIMPAAQYRPQFDQYYRSFFAPINSMGRIKKMIDIANADAEVCGSFNCPAFCSPAIHTSARRVYVNADEPNTYATLCHELCHYISHGNFYPEFYAMGGPNPDILEGVTEYLTRAISPEIEKDRRTRRKYQTQYDAVRNALIAGSQGEIDVIKFALLGEYVPLQGLGGVQFGQAPLAPPPAPRPMPNPGG